VLSIYKQDHKKAIEQYFKVLDFDPYNRNAYTNSILVLGSIDNTRETAYKISALKHLYAINPDNADVNYNLGKMYGQFLGNTDSSCYFLERSISLNSGNISAYKDLGIVYSMRGEYNKALDVFSRAQKLDPSDQQVRQNIMITNQIMNQKKR
jgi:tetratricopeptide (TPR) repeat protein